MSERLTLELPPGISREELRRIVDEWRRQKDRGSKGPGVQHFCMIFGPFIAVGMLIAWTNGWTAREIFDPLTILATIGVVAGYFIGRHTGDDAYRQQAALEEMLKPYGLKIDNFDGHPVNAATGERIAL